MGNVEYEPPEAQDETVERYTRGEQIAAGWPLSSSSLAYENSRVVKYGPGIIYGFSVYSATDAPQWVQLFDADALPANGDVPDAIYVVANAQNLGVSWADVGRFCSQGIILCNSSTGPTLTIGSATCFFDAQYI